MQDETLRQLNFINIIKENNKGKKAFTDTYGCQQNVADTQAIAGMLSNMGYEITDDESIADIIVINTCAVRENAELKTLSRIGELGHYKKDKPSLIISIFGCMVQQKHISDKLKKTYPFVDIVFGTHAMNTFPELLYKRLKDGENIIDLTIGHTIAEGLPVLRDGNVRAWLSIMYGCDNFCTYCIVPHVRGRERSRKPEDILKEFRDLVDSGYKEITLLGQNVNSYGKGLDLDFADLLELLAKEPGNFYIRFMTSVPKDANFKLIDVMAKYPKIAKQLHLPVQSGSDKILKDMNRKYTAKGYLELIDYAREKMPEITISSDIIIGFPGESIEDFEMTLELIKRVRFNALYTYLYSKRSGTKAALMPDAYDDAFKQKNFEKLLLVQNNIALEKNIEYDGKVITVIVEGTGKNAEYPHISRSEGGLLVLVSGDDIKDGDILKVLCIQGTMRSILAKKI